MSTRWRALAVVWVVTLAACAFGALTGGPSTQEAVCGRLPQNTCDQVIDAVRAQVPDTERSTLAIADFAAPDPAATATATDLSVCFILLLHDAGLTDYAPTFPSGACGEDE